MIDFLTIPIDYLNFGADNNDMHAGKISSQRQVTIPKFILKMVGAEVNDKVIISVEKNKIVLEPFKGSLTDRLAGSLAHLVPPEKRNAPLDVIEEETMKQVVQDIFNEDPH